MNISPVNNTSFQSKNSQLRNYDRYLRVFNSEFPSTSTSKLDKFQVVDRYDEAKDLYHNLARKFYFTVRWDVIRLRDKSEPLDYYTKLVDIIRSKHKANCNEMIDLTRLILGVNDIPSYRAILEPRGIIDHGVVAVSAKKDIDLSSLNETPLTQLKDVIIVDPWCGFVDYAPNAAVNYVTTNANLVGKRMYEGWMGIPADGKFHNKIRLRVENDKQHDVKCDLKDSLKLQYPEFILN